MRQFVSTRVTTTRFVCPTPAVHWSRLPTFAAVDCAAALYRLRRPLVPTSPTSDAFGSTLRRIRFLICAGVDVGNFVNRKAAAPATCGVAIEVRLKKL